MQHFGKRKFGGGGGSGRNSNRGGVGCDSGGSGGGSAVAGSSDNGNTQQSPSDYYMSPKNQRLRPCRDIIYTEDSVPVRKIYFCVPNSEVSEYITKLLFKYISILKRKFDCE